MASSAVLRELQSRAAASAAQQPLAELRMQHNSVQGPQGEALPKAPKPRSPLRKTPTPPKQAGLAWELDGPSAECPSMPAHAGAAPAGSRQDAAQPPQAHGSSDRSVDGGQAVAQADGPSAGCEPGVGNAQFCVSHTKERRAASGAGAAAVPGCCSNNVCRDMAALQWEVLELREQVCSGFKNSARRLLWGRELWLV